jgi:hypothetical protein
MLASELGNVFGHLLGIFAQERIMFYDNEGYGGLLPRSSLTERR